MRCPDVERLLPEQLGSTLDPATRAALNDHLEECSRCRRSLAEMQEAWQALEGLAAADRADPVPPLAARSLRPPVRRRSSRAAGHLLRAAVLVLAGYGAARLLAPSRPQELEETVRAAVHQALRPMFADVVGWMHEQEGRQEAMEADVRQAWTELTAVLQGWARARDTRDVRTIEALAATRADLDLTQVHLGRTQDALVRLLTAVHGGG